MKMTLKQMIENLQNAQFQGAATDEPEGSRFVNMSATLVNQFVESLQDVQANQDLLLESQDSYKQAAETALLERDVDVALAKADLDLGSADAMAAFRTELLETGSAEAAQEKIDAKAIALGQDDNNPGLKASSTDNLKTSPLDLN